MGVCILIFALGVFQVFYGGLPWIEGVMNSFMSSISLAISAVPEGLPAVVTITLALGAREFAKRNAIVRRLSSAESLGAVTIICSDKTGTITKGEMTVRQVFVNNKIYEVTGVGYEPKGELRLGKDLVKPEGDIEFLLRVGALCSNAQLRRNEQNRIWEIFGDPTEGALIVAAAKVGLQKDLLEKSYPRVSEIPFTSERKRMTTIHKTPKDETFAYMKGAPETVLERCKFILENGQEKTLSNIKKKKILDLTPK